MAEYSERKSDIMRRQIVDLISVLTSAGVIWVGSSIIDVKTTIAGLYKEFGSRAEMEAIKRDVSEIKSKQDQRASTIEEMRQHLKETRHR